MTKERRWAIQMWEQIRERLPEWYTFERFAISKRVLAYKHEFCSSKRVHWLNDCWLCQYAMKPNCKRCPLQSCGYMSSGDASPWQVVMDYHYSLDLKLKACDKIITALKGANKSEETENAVTT